MDSERRHFGKYDEFSDLQHSFLSIDLDDEPTLLEDSTETILLSKLSEILDEYQEQSFLLDPFLENLVTPVVLKLKAHARFTVRDGDRGSVASSARVGRIALLLYSYIKVRGHKIIVQYFPHEVPDLPTALAYMLLPDSPTRDSQNWALRYVVLLWLGLVCMLPFDLAKFDDDGSSGENEGSEYLGCTTAARLDSLARKFLGSAGLEREGAALLLARLYTRSDTLLQFHAFLDWSSNLQPDALGVFTSMGILHVIYQVIKSGSAEQSRTNLTRIFQVSEMIGGNPTLAANSLIRKLKVKLLGRVALRSLPARSKESRQKSRMLFLSDISSHGELDRYEEDIDVPENVEVALGELFNALQDKSTIVRWSASKGVARISERLPRDFVDQVLDTITGLFSIHSVTVASIYDMPAISESTWHGACLACAEMARRGLVNQRKLPGLLSWLSKALYFDIRKGMHSIGSNVRDAAAYVFWALARSQSPFTFSNYAEDVARQLAVVALYDREIHVRRAASAAFQEHVGRMNLFPHGIDVLRKTDFYAVSVRRSAFLVAAPQVAEHTEYRRFLFDHLLDVTLRHWDPSMRELGAQSLGRILTADLLNLGPEAAHRAARLFGSVDVNEIHGGLLALVEIAASYRNSEIGDKREDKLHDTFKYLASIPYSVIQSPRNELVTAAACYLIANSITLSEIESGAKSHVPHWRNVVENGLKHNKGTVQEAAATAMAAISKLLRSGSFMVQQSLGRFLGCLDYASYPHGLQAAVNCLLECTGESPLKRLTDVEARRNCYLAMPRILQNVSPHLTQYMAPDMVKRMLGALLHGLNDYTMDERGDVGSWIRIACIEGLASYSEVLLSHATEIPNFEEYFHPDCFHDAVGGILKQGVERLDGVRQEAGEQFRRILALPAPNIPSGEIWRIQDHELMEQLFLSTPSNEAPGWNDSSWLFPKAVRLLQVEQYRKQILAGLVLSIDSKTDSTQRYAASSLVAYARSLPLEGTMYSISTLARDLVDQARSGITSNAVVIPVLRTLNALLEAEGLERLSECTHGLESLKALCEIASRNVSRLKNMQRVMESMKIIVHLLSFETLFALCTSVLAEFLAHEIPKVRTDTAEFLYNAFQTKTFWFDTEDIETLLLETEWSMADIWIAQETANRVTRRLLYYQIRLD